MASSPGPAVTYAPQAPSVWGNDSALVDNATDSSYYDDFQHRLLMYNLKVGFTCACYGLAILLGTLGNVLVIYTIWRCRHLHTVMYTLLASLSVADLIMIVLVLPWRLHLLMYVGPWVYGEFMCRFPLFLYLLSGVSSVFHLTVISLERCYAVTFPLKSRTVLTMGNAYRMVVLVWLTAVVASTPMLFSKSTKQYEDVFWGSYLLCRSNWSNMESKQAFALYVFFVMFGVPMVLIVTSYSIIFKTLLARHIPNDAGGKSEAIAMSQSRRYQAGQGAAKTGSVYAANGGTQKLNKNAARNKDAEIKQLTAMLVVVISLFAIAWGPKLTLTVCENFGVVDQHSELGTVLDMVFSLMAFLNSAVNPIMYALVSPNFRESCKWALKVCCKSRRVRRRPSAASRATTVSRAGMTNGSVTYVDNVSISSSACAGDKI